MRVLFATDGSAEASAALRAGSRLLTLTDRQVDVLYVVPELRAPKSGAITKGAFQHRIAEHTRRVLQDAKQTLAEEGSDALTLAETGSPAGIILREAEDCDITVIGAKGVNAHSDVGLGPVASRVVEHANGCVLVGREPPGDKGIRILVPVDGSDGSSQALDILNSFFDIDSAEITLLHVLETQWLPVREEDQAEERNPESMQRDQLAVELRREAEQLLAEARLRISEHHPGVTALVREGNPGNEILSEADQGDYDLVVVGASPPGDMKHRMLGSVSIKVAWNAPCSVLVVRVPE